MNMYIVIQMCVEKTIIENGSQNTQMVNIVRKIDAETKEQAIGKFVINTQNVIAQQKLSIECYDLAKLNSIV